MSWEQLRGHGSLVEAFRRAIQRGRLAHGYLFVGPHGVGKRHFARQLAQCLFCHNFAESEMQSCGTCPACKQVQAHTHPDLLEIGCPEGKKDLPIDLIVGPSERRGREGLCHDLALRPMSASRRIAIINDAELMNEASANALLKTLEEPPPGAILILTTPDLDQILPTIRSRCQPVRFSALTETDVTELLLELKLVENRTTAAETAALSEGSLATAKELLEPELRALRKAVMAPLREREMRPLKAAEAVLTSLEAVGSDTATQRQYVGWALRFAVEELRQQLTESTDLQATDRLGDMLDRCIEAEFHLRQTMPIPLCLEALFDALSRLQRGQSLLPLLG